MDKFIINGGKKLSGVIDIGSAKNAVLPLLAASMLVNGEVIIHKCPNISDVSKMTQILEHMGCTASLEGGSLTVNSIYAHTGEIEPNLAKEIRSSIFLLGSILSRFKEAKVAYPGGCDIGLRPIDLHLKGLRELGVKITDSSGHINCDGRHMKAASVHLDSPSVGATENIMMAAVFLEGRSEICNAAREPEIVDLASFINKAGGKVYGAGTSTIVIEGVKELHSCEFTPVADRIQAGTYIIGCAICGGDILVKNAVYDHIYSLIFKLRECGAVISAESNGDLRIKCGGRLRNALRLETMPYPGFPTDLQAQYLALAAVSDGTCMIVENIFETRFKHVAELTKMGACIAVKDRVAIVRGVERLQGANVFAEDLRGGAALVLAGLAAQGRTVVNNVWYIDRGYEMMERDLKSLGADIVRRN